DKLNGDPVPWLLENDKTQPAIRYYALRDVLGRGENDSEVKAAKAAIMASGPVPVILAAQQPEGYWDKGISGPIFRGTQSSLVLLAQLGADGADPRVRAGCEFLLSRYIASNGALSWSGRPSSVAHCGTGILGAALIDFGWLDDERLQTAMEWLAQTITGEGVADASSRNTNKRYYKSGNSGPLFLCASNNNMSCAWGAIKSMLAFSKIPPAQRTRTMEEAIEQGVEFLLSYDPAVADYPFDNQTWLGQRGGTKPSTNWFKFGYPIGYIADVLQNLEALAALGQIGNPKLANALALVVSKQNQQGRWLLEHAYNGKSWVDIEKKGQPSKWVTLRALRVLKAAYPETG
ncbi:MAG: nitrogen fixation protein NifH, partial [Chloroflexi bacterium]|nr:nitrogen fixation protein NifH [Chloroflexota bacterium]